MLKILVHEQKQSQYLIRMDDGSICMNTANFSFCIIGMETINFHNKLNSNGPHERLLDLRSNMAADMIK